MLIHKLIHNAALLMTHNWFLMMLCLFLIMVPILGIVMIHEEEFYKQKDVDRYR